VADPATAKGGEKRVCRGVHRRHLSCQIKAKVWALVLAQPSCQSNARVWALVLEELSGQSKARVWASVLAKLVHYPLHHVI
jgi:hypothetical protein